MKTGTMESTMNVQTSLYERIGGEAAIIAAVDIFYQKVLSDEITRPFFEGLDLEAQSRKQVAFMAWAFGGPAEFKGRNLRAAHLKLVRQRGLSDVHFDAVARHLEATLRELEVEEELIRAALTIIVDTRQQVLGQ